MPTAAILVTGGTGGLGRAVARRLAAAGSPLYLPWVLEREVDEFRAEAGQAAGAIHLHRCDVTVEQDVQGLFRTVEQAGHRVEVLVNVVGGFAAAPVTDTELVVWNRMLQLNLTSVFLCCREAAKHMKAARRGRIVNISSAPAVNRGAANLSAYSAAKAGVLNFTESLAKELVGWGITVNAIVPTVIDTPANRKASPDADRSTWLPPGEIAEVIAFLASEPARIVTGTAVNLSLG